MTIRKWGYGGKSVSGYSKPGHRTGTWRSWNRRGRAVRRCSTYALAETGGRFQSYGSQQFAGQMFLYGCKAGFQREASDVATLLPTSPQVSKNKLIAVVTGPSPILLGKRNRRFREGRQLPEATGTRWQGGLLTPSDFEIHTARCGLHDLVP